MIEFHSTIDNGQRRQSETFLFPVITVVNFASKNLFYLVVTLHEIPYQVLRILSMHVSSLFSSLIRHFKEDNKRGVAWKIASSIWRNIWLETYVFIFRLLYQYMQISDGAHRYQVLKRIDQIMLYTIYPRMMCRLARHAYDYDQRRVYQEAVNLYSVCCNLLNEEITVYLLEITSYP